MRKFVYILFLLILTATTLFAQQRKVQNKPYIDYRRLHYGFFVGVHMQDLELVNNGYITPEGEQWYADVAAYSPGFSVGVLADLRINSFLSLRLIPTMHFGDKTVVFREKNSDERERQQIKSTYISLPLEVKFTAERFNNYRPYVIAGVSPMIDLTVKKQRPILVKPFDLMLEFGLGCDFYLPFFKLNPELKFAFSILDILDKNRSDLIDMNYLKYTESLGGATAKMVVLSFYFE
ncbi:MAG: PorT family protein [Bacteroidaceae bacterium]|nr:PorT family protein [Bacteroidaceae bacterium]